MDSPTFSIQPLGDSAVLAGLGEAINPAVNRRIIAFAAHLEASRLPGITDIVPTYAAVMVCYDPLRLTLEVVTGWLNHILHQTADRLDRQRHLIEIPTHYGGTDGPDLDDVAIAHDISTDDVIRIHSERTYQVYMIGFTPGFPYLGELDPRIRTPRLQTPRPRVPAGSVGIAGDQTGIYPIESPGGWQIIGRTALRLFDLKRDPPFLLSPGDMIRFVPVSGPVNP